MHALCAACWLTLSCLVPNSGGNAARDCRPHDAAARPVSETPECQPSLTSQSRPCDDALGGDDRSVSPVPRKHDRGQTLVCRPTGHSSQFNGRPGRNVSPWVVPLLKMQTLQLQGVRIQV